MSSSISVIIPVFNMENYILEDCIDSVMGQTLSPDEVIIIFDGCPVDQILLNKYNKLGKIKIVHKPANEGVNFARRDGYLASSGEYVVFVDADDILENDFMSIHLNAIKKYNANVSISKTRRFYGLYKDNPFISKKTEALYSVVSKYDSVKNFISGSTPFEDTPMMVMWGKMYQRKVLEDLDWSIGNYKHGEDYFSGIQIANNTTRTVYINIYLYNYRKNRIGKLTNNPKYNVDPKGKQISNGGYVESLMRLYTNIANVNHFDLTADINTAEQVLRQHWAHKESKS